MAGQCNYGVSHGYRERQKRGQRGKTLNCIAKDADCWQSAVSKHINGELNGRAKCGRRRYTIKRDNKGEQSPFQNMGEIHKVLPCHHAQM